MALNDFDLNIHDWGSHESSGTYSAWRIDIYADVSNHQHAEKIIYLTDTQVEMLKLDECDDDWWADPESFLRQHNNMPRKVRRILENLEVTA